MIEKTCLTCGKKFYVKKYREKTAKYCSIKCASVKKEFEPNAKCEFCGKKLYRRKSLVERSKEFFCDKKCAGKLRSIRQKGKETWNKGKIGLQIAWNKGLHLYNLRGENSASWKGGLVKGCKGYLRKRVNVEYKLEHRVVMENFLGRKLKKEEIVHHINGNRSDNRIENLMLFENNSAHVKHHAQLRKQKCIK